MTQNLRIDPKKFFYAGQIKKYLIQFAAIFSEMQVSIGKNDFNSESNLIHIPIKYGSMDRTVGHIMTSHTQNKPLRLPLFAFKLIGIDQNPDHRKGVMTVHRHTRVPLGGTLTDDAEVPYVYMPIPYELRIELASFASNTEQDMQIVEQILMLFDPDLHLWTSDVENDGTKINKLELIDVNLEEAYPSADQSRMIVNTYNFKCTCYLAPPVDIKKNYIKSVRLKLETLALDASMQEYVDSAGDMPNDDGYSTLFDIEDYDIPDN